MDSLSKAVNIQQVSHLNNWNSCSSSSNSLRNCGFCLVESLLVSKHDFSMHNVLQTPPRPLPIYSGLIQPLNGPIYIISSLGLSSVYQSAVFSPSLSGGYTSIPRYCPTYILGSGLPQRYCDQIERNLHHAPNQRQRRYATRLYEYASSRLHLFY